MEESDRRADDRRSSDRRSTDEYPHPFIHRVKLTGPQRIRGLVLGSVLFPLRVTLAAMLFLLSWPLARLRLAGLSAEERSRPVTGWRWWYFQVTIWLLSRGAFFSLGFLWVKVKGRRADLKEAPVLVAAPHSSFLDILVLCTARLPAVVSRSENSSLPVIGALLESNQCVLVSRTDPESRKKVVAQVTERLTSGGYWPQMLMFPEGTTTNGRSLIRFKPGAFLAGVPVQPVLLRYPNKLDTVCWTYEGTSWIEALWHTTSQLYTNMTVEFLPVYNPSPEEKNNPKLFADNVQKLMAKALGVPATDYVMEGGVPVRKVGDLSLLLESPARKTLSLLHDDGLEAFEMEASLDRMIDRCQSRAQGSKVSAEELFSLLGLKRRETSVRLCGLFSKDQTVDVRQFYLSVASGRVGFRSLLHTAFRLFDGEGRGRVSAEELSGLMGALLGFPQRNTAQLFREVSAHGPVTAENLLRVLTTHPTYQRVANEYLQPEEAVSRLPFTPLANEKPENNNRHLQDNDNKKFE
ncbi:putative lysophospholipid acyltransferase LPCAT4 [Scophthalmus maximus]|uniref:Putative lysophospholipid acyltransferase LPCAT4 n=1 Tax=Scophthalmus maximus TaxID=52904 RepID=A0A2U9AZV1_SCOMX|nr:lysophospholipid acyltransferase LPCAT4 [Scophthalmus maximus]AWO97203.1 putative lysophospholipid acyltransferase LPCAT4 [Scophthalmus maximus]